MTVSNILKLVLHWSGFGEEGTLNWYFSGADHVSSPSELSDAAGNVLTHWDTDTTPSQKTGFLGMLLAAQKVDKLSLYQYATLPGNASAQGEVSPSGWVGTATLMYGPLQTALCATTLTAHPGASYRGRQYFPGHVFQPSQASGLISNTATDQTATLAANMGTGAASAVANSLGIGTVDWVVYSPTKGIVTPITQVRVDNKLDTQRRREASLQPSHVQLVSV